MMIDVMVSFVIDIVVQVRNHAVWIVVMMVKMTIILMMGCIIRFMVLISVMMHWIKYFMVLVIMVHRLMVGIVFRKMMASVDHSIKGMVNRVVW